MITTMKVKDLIEELQRFDGDANVAVEVHSTKVSGFDSCKTFEPVEVKPTNDGRHSLKIIARP